MDRFGFISLLVGALTAAGGPPGAIAQAKPQELPAQAEKILRNHCFACHGQNPQKIRGDGLKVLDHALLLAKERKIVVPRKPEQSLLVLRIDDDDDPMPPPPRPRVPPADRKWLRAWIAAGAPPWPRRPGLKAAPAGNLAARVKEIFRTRCFECHGGTKTNAGIKILDHDLLVKKKKVIPGKPGESLLFRLITSKGEPVMPGEGQPRLGSEDIEAIRGWITAGAPPFPADVARPGENAKDPTFKGVVGVHYVLTKILEHIRRLADQDRSSVRYFSINHLLVRGVTREELDLHRDALAKAVNHLSWERRLVRPEAIDRPVNTVFAVDIRKLGWHKQLFERIRAQKTVGRSTLNLFDLALLEYPYGTIYPDSDTFNRLAEEYLIPAGLVRPIAYVRADWFVSIATQPPLYEDFLRLPAEVKDLETRLGVNAAANVRDLSARRAGLTVSGVSRNNRVVERHPAKYGAYWKSFDFRSSKGRENVFRDPIKLNPAGGEMIFNLPNGLQGYYVANGKGQRLEFAPTDIVIDKFAQDKTIRNGLACMRCHDRGIKSFTDTVRSTAAQLPGGGRLARRRILGLYARQKEMDKYLQEDEQRFVTAVEKVLGKVRSREPLIPVTQRFLDAPLGLSIAAAELGLPEAGGLRAVFRRPPFAALGLVPLASDGVVHRDLWEDYYDQAVRHLGLGIPVVPLDGRTRRDGQPNPLPLQVELKTNKKNNSFEPGDQLVIHVANKSPKDIYIELIGTSAQGKKIILAPSSTRVKAGQIYRYPPDGKEIRIRGRLGKEQITLFASAAAFPAGELLRGKGVADRVVHPFYTIRPKGKRLRLVFDPVQVVKKTIEIQTR
jgi:serine/threonine-protein kinase